MIGKSFPSGLSGTRGATPRRRSASTELSPARVAIPNVWIERTNGNAQSEVDDRSQVLNAVDSSQTANSMRGPAGDAGPPIGRRVSLLLGNHSRVLVPRAY